jgi:hypothetical protein
VIRRDFAARDALAARCPDTFSVPRQLAEHMMLVADLVGGHDDLIEDALRAAWELQASHAEDLSFAGLRWPSPCPPLDVPVRRTPRPESGAQLCRPDRRRQVREDLPRLDAPRKPDSGPGQLLHHRTELVELADEERGDPEAVAKVGELLDEARVGPDEDVR